MEKLLDEELELLYKIQNLPDKYHPFLEILDRISSPRDFQLANLHGLVQKGYLERKFLTVRVFDEDTEIDASSQAGFRIKPEKKVEVAKLVDDYVLRAYEKKEVIIHGAQAAYVLVKKPQ